MRSPACTTWSRGDPGGVWQEASRHPPVRAAARPPAPTRQAQFRYLSPWPSAGGERIHSETAYAIRDLPAASRIRLLHFGKAHTDDWARKARDEMARNPRYHWMGEVPGWRVRPRIPEDPPDGLELGDGGRGQCDFGGGGGGRADHRVGNPWDDWPARSGLYGYFPAKNTRALRALLLRAERDPAFVAEFAAQGAARRYLFTVERERAAWAKVLEAVTRGA